MTPETRAAIQAAIDAHLEEIGRLQSEVRQLRQQLKPAPFLASLYVPVEVANGHILPARIANKITIHPRTQCWLWQGGLDRTGYGHLQWEGKRVGVHRLVYTLLVGEIPPGLQMDHVKAHGCISTACCNPDHLEPVTMKVNQQRSVHVFKPLKRRSKGADSCCRGHKLTEENMYRRGDGSIECRECRRYYRNRSRALADAQRKALR